MEALDLLIWEMNVSPVLYNLVLTARATPKGGALSITITQSSQCGHQQIVAAELPLRGKLRAEATDFSINKRILEVIL